MVCLSFCYWEVLGLFMVVMMMAGGLSFIWVLGLSLNLGIEFCLGLNWQLWQWVVRLGCQR